MTFDQLSSSCLPHHHLSSISQPGPRSNLKIETASTENSQDEEKPGASNGSSHSDIKIMPPLGHPLRARAIGLYKEVGNPPLFFRFTSIETLLIPFLSSLLVRSSID